MKTNLLDYTLLSLVIIGAVNWGLIGFFRFDLVAFLFGICPGYHALFTHWLESAVFIHAVFSGVFVPMEKIK